jgi:hypothetical protein
MKRALLTTSIAALAISAACATAKHLEWQWADLDPKLLEQVDRTDDAVAVTLLSEQRFVFQTLGLYGEGRTEVHYHTVKKLLTEDGVDAAAGTVPWPKKGTLLHLDARTIAPDGTITPVTEEELFADEVKWGRDEKARRSRPTCGASRSRASRWAASSSCRGRSR